MGETDAGETVNNEIYMITDIETDGPAPGPQPTLRTGS